MQHVFHLASQSIADRCCGCDIHRSHMPKPCMLHRAHIETSSHSSETHFFLSDCCGYRGWRGARSRLGISRHCRSRHGQSRGRHGQEGQQVGRSALHGSLPETWLAHRCPSLASLQTPPGLPPRSQKLGNAALSHKICLVCLSMHVVE